MCNAANIKEKNRRKNITHILFAVVQYYAVYTSEILMCILVVDIEKHCTINEMENVNEREEWPQILKKFSRKQKRESCLQAFVLAITDFRSFSDFGKPEELAKAARDSATKSR